MRTILAFLLKLKLLLLALQAHAAATPGLAPRELVICADPGGDPDDHVTLALALTSPELKVLGIVGSHIPMPGFERSAEYTAERARAALEHLPVAERPPVVAGSNHPLASRRSAGREAELQGARFLLEATRHGTPRRRIPVLVLGPATDVARALLLDPGLADRIEVLAMAFRSWPEGGDSWNVRGDVRAWQNLLESRAPITVSDGVVARKDLVLSRSEFSARFGRLGRAGAYLDQVHGEWLTGREDACLHETGHPDRWPIWDIATVAFLLGLAEAETLPRPRLLPDTVTFAHPCAAAWSPDPARPETQLRWIRSVDADALWKRLAAQLGDGG